MSEPLPLLGFPSSVVDDRGHPDLQALVDAVNLLSPVRRLCPQVLPVVLVLLVLFVRVPEHLREVDPRDPLPPEVLVGRHWLLLRASPFEIARGSLGAGRPAVI